MNWWVTSITVLSVRHILRRYPSIYDLFNVWEHRSDSNKNVDIAIYYVNYECFFALLKSIVPKNKLIS